MADFGAFGADRRGGCSFGAGSAIIRAAGSLLGADYNPGDHAVIAGCGVHCFVAAIRRDGAWSGSGRDCGESLRAARACIRYLRVHPGPAPRHGTLGSNRISVRGRYLGDCAVDPTGRSCMANRLSSVRRSVHRNWGGANLGVGVAGEGSHTIGEKLNSSFIPSEKDGPLAKKNIAELFVDVLAEAGVRQIYGGFS
jgi:hypothetical protein